MPRKSMKELVQSQEWQKVRQSLVGQWTKRPEWCCQQLSNYLGHIKTASYDKLRIVMNYLVGTGFRTGRIKHACVSALRAKISEEMKRRRANKLNEWLSNLQ